jgi:O-acetylserine/cysteine efflux transporter
MHLRHIGVALIIVAIWGFSFVAIKVGLQQIPPFSLNFWRFALAAFPAILFLRRPAVAWKWIVLYGLANGVAQFGLLYTGLQVGMPAGLASLVIQSQAFFTIIVMITVFHEKLLPQQKWGGAVMLVGLLALAALKVQGVSFQGAGAFWGLLLTVAAAMAWASANLVARFAKPTDAVAFIAWASLVAAPINLLIALIFESSAESSAQSGAQWGAQVLAPIQLIVSNHSGALAIWVSVLYLAWPSTLLAFALYNRLLAIYGTKVAPFTLLVPVTGMGGAYWLLDERISAGQMAACVLVFLGLVINVFGAQVHSFARPLLGRKK